MYDITRALKRFRQLIKYTAYRYVTRPNPLTTFDDVEAEGLLTLVKCCREFPDGEVKFGHYFKRAWYNRIKDLNRHRIRILRSGFEVELEEAESVPAVSDRTEFLERMWGKYDEVSPLLSEQAKKLLMMLLDPTPATDIAYKDFQRKQRLQSRGRFVRGGKRFRIKLRHIRIALHMSKADVRKAVREVRAVKSHVRE